MTAASPYQALLFDFDGVIAESVDIKTRAFAELYQEYGTDVVAQVVAYHEAHGGISRFEKFRHYEKELLGKPALTSERETLLASRFAQLVVDNVVAAAPVPGIDAVLEYYRGWTPMFVISGTPEVELQQIVSRRGLSPFFERLMGSPVDKSVHIASVLQEYDYVAERVLMLGDATTDYAAARANGTLFLGRVPAGASNPFPGSVTVLRDFTECRGGQLPEIAGRHGKATPTQ